MIRVTNLSKAYGAQVIFDEVSFTVGRGERVGLVGRNGHGKTTLFHMITGEELPDGGSIAAPDDYRIGYLSQHLRFSGESVLEEASLGLAQSEDGRDETYKVETVLSGLGFVEEDLARSPLSLSGGYQVRLNLAKLLVNRPNLLLLDEPTNYLDILAVRWLAQFLKGWKDELILITHDRDFMDSVITHTMGIHRHKVRKIEGPTWKLYEQIATEEEVYEKTRLNDEKRRREIERFINRFRAKATKAKAVQSRIKALEKREIRCQLTAERTLDFEFKGAPFSGKRLLEADNLSFSFGNSHLPLIEGLSFAIGKKDRVGVIGRNGKGKTTLLNLLAGELQPSEGKIARHADLKMAYFGQTNIMRLSPVKTVEEEILDSQAELNRNAARNICGAMMFEGDLALKKIGVLSGGEKSRVLLGKLLVSPSNLLLLDEPTNHLDMESIDSLIEAIDAFEGAVMIVTHSELILHAVAERLIVFDNDRAGVFEGTYGDFLDRVGWSGEGQVPAGGKSSLMGLNKRDLRRMRAEVIDERSQVIGRLQKRIDEVEEEIILLEDAVESHTRGLLEASGKGDGDAIRKLSISLHEAKGKIDPLFDELIVLNEELACRSREFEGRLELLAETGV